MTTRKQIVVTCPQCRKEHAWDSANRYRPFCSERCKLIDLGKWANEEYRVEQPERNDGNQEDQA
jgi:endogenous inhibitor of DNA gyrase (YacG/DUF329 family)